MRNNQRRVNTASGMNQPRILRIATALFLLAAISLLSACKIVPTSKIATLAAAYSTPGTPAAAASAATASAMPIQAEEPPQCDSMLAGKVTRHEIRSKVLPQPYTVSVYTPPCYDETHAESYPVLYLLHGQNMDDTFWFKLGAAEIVDELIAQGSPPFIMVMPYEVKNFDPPGDSKFYDAVLTELIPWVEGNFSVCTERACRAVGGISRGGGWAIRLAARNFEMFSSVGGHSMGLMAGDTWQMQKYLKTHTIDEYPRIFIDRGEDDYLYDGIDYFVDSLEKNGIPHEFHIFPGRHDIAYWQAHVEEYLTWYAAGFK